jgi:hypothetical protein
LLTRTATTEGGFVVHAEEKLSAFVELERQVLKRASLLWVHYVTPSEIH